jgi:transcriptional regulator with XRE-family HTH domain
MTDSETDIDKTIGGNIRVRRLLRGWSQADVGERLGVSYQQVQKYECGANALRPALLRRLSELFGCSIHDLFYSAADVADREGFVTPGHRETARIWALIRSFVRIESPALQEHACAIVRTLAAEQAQ